MKLNISSWMRHFAPAYPAMFFAVLLTLGSCVLMPGHGFSESKNKHASGDNLGFEYLKKGYPVNWAFKTQRVINHMSKNGDVVDFDFIMDTTDAKEGHQSIRYVIRKCNSTPANMRMYAYYPGFFNEFDGVPGTTYKVSFWVKNQGCDFEVLSSAVREMGGGPCENHSIHSNETITEWKQFSMEQTVCPDM